MKKIYRVARSKDKQGYTHCLGEAEHIRKLKYDEIAMVFSEEDMYNDLYNLSQSNKLEFVIVIDKIINSCKHVLLQN